MITPVENRGPILSFKLLLPEYVYRVMTKPVSGILRLLPDNFLYWAGLKLRRGKFPYKVINEGDIVVQIGAPRDLLSVGRSRAAYFMRLVGSGKLVIFEPDPENVQALKNFIAKNNFEKRVILVDKGAWSKDDELTFLSSPLHPAANLVQGTEEISEADMARRKYKKLLVPVTTLDKILETHKLPTPKLTSITANGSESEILKGMERTIGDGLKYISLAITGEKYPEMMAEHGYEIIANDDRGFTFALK